MKTDVTNYSKSFSLLNATVEKFIQEVNKQKTNNLVTEKWTVKDVLCHIVFWHQYYAKQYKALTTGQKPFIFTSKGGSTRNEEGVNSMKHSPKEDLVKMLNKAQSSLYSSIVMEKIPQMDYTDKKRCTTSDFLNIVIGHIKRHTIQVRKAKKF